MMDRPEVLPTTADAPIPDGYNRYHLPTGKAVLILSDRPRDRIETIVDNLIAPPLPTTTNPLVNAPAVKGASDTYSQLAKGFTSHLAGKLEPVVQQITSPLVDLERVRQGEPVSQVAQNPAAAIERPGVALPGAQAVAKGIIPQTPAEAAATVLTPLGKTPAARVTLGAVGGALGGAVGPEGPVRGALEMGAGAAGGETVAGILGLIARSAPGQKAAINAQDTRKLITWMEDTIPALRGVATDAQSLQAAAKGSEAREALTDYFRGKMDEVQRRIGNRTIFVPSLDQSRMMTFKEATEQLAKIGNQGYGGAKADPNARTIVGKEAREVWAKAVQEIETEVNRFGGPKAVDAFLDGRQNYSKGLSLLQLLRKSDSFIGYPSRVDLNTRALQGRVQDRQGMLENRFDTDEFAALVSTVFRGGKPGTKDRLAPGPGGLIDALRDVYGRGIGGAPQVAGSLLRTGLPNIGSTYVGDLGPAFSASRSVRSLLDVAGERTLPGLALPPRQDSQE